MHLDDERLQRVLHEELDPGAKAAALNHLESCPRCRARLEEARSDESRIFGLLRAIDVAPPPADARSFAGRPRPQAAAWGRRAASVAIILGVAAVAYTAPGSPVPRWIERATGFSIRPSPPRPAEPPPPAEPQAPLAAGPVTAGITVDPGAGLTIRFAARQETGSLVVIPGGGDEVIVRVIGDEATFSSGVDRLTVQNAGSRADYEIELPASAPRIDILVGDDRLLLQTGGRVVSGPAAGTDGRRVLSLAPQK